MKRRAAAILLCVISLPVLAAKKPSTAEDLLDKSILNLGGYGKYQRLETVVYEFTERDTSGAEAVLSTGRHAFKLHDAGGLRLREERRSAAGSRVTLVTSAGVWQWLDGKPVADAAALDAARERLVGDAFWLLAPYVFKERGFASKYLGMGYLAGKLDHRLELSSGAPAAAAPFLVFLDTATQQLDGAEYESAGAKRRVFYAPPSDLRSLALSLERRTYDEGGRRLAQFNLLNPVLNGFLEESLFDPANASGNASGEGGGPSPKSP